MMKNWRRWLTLTHVKVVNSLQEGLMLTKKLLNYGLSIIGIVSCKKNWPITIKCEENNRLWLVNFLRFTMLIIDGPLHPHAIEKYWCLKLTKTKKFFCLSIARGIRFAKILFEDFINFHILLIISVFKQRANRFE